MDGKFLGKITKADIVLDGTSNHMFGLQLDMSLDGGKIGVETAHHYKCNLSVPDESVKCEWIVNTVYKIINLLGDAKCTKISQLVGKPIEATIESSTLKSFRILTEVL